MNPPIFAFTVQEPTQLHIEGFEYKDNYSVLGCEFEIIHRVKKGDSVTTSKIGTIISTTPSPIEFFTKGVYEIIPIKGTIKTWKIFNFYQKPIACHV